MARHKLVTQRGEKRTSAGDVFVILLGGGGRSGAVVLVLHTRAGDDDDVGAGHEDGVNHVHDRATGIDVAERNGGHGAVVAGREQVDGVAGAAHGEFGAGRRLEALSVVQVRRREGAVDDVHLQHSLEGRGVGGQRGERIGAADGSKGSVTGGKDGHLSPWVEQRLDEAGLDEQYSQRCQLPRLGGDGRRGVAARLLGACVRAVLVDTLRSAELALRGGSAQVYFTRSAAQCHRHEQNQATL